MYVQTLDLHVSRGTTVDTQSLPPHHPRLRWRIKKSSWPCDRWSYIATCPRTTLLQWATVECTTGGMLSDTKRRMSGVEVDRDSLMHGSDGARVRTTMANTVDGAPNCRRAQERISTRRMRESNKSGCKTTTKRGTGVTEAAAAEVEEALPLNTTTAVAVACTS